MAYALPSISRVATSLAPPSASNPPVPLVAESLAERVPLPCTRIAWTAFSPGEATMAYVLPPASTAAMPSASPILSNPPMPFVAEPAAASTARGSASIAMSFEWPSEPGEPGGGRVALAAVPSRPIMLPPGGSDRAPAPA